MQTTKLPVNNDLANEWFFDLCKSQGYEVALHARGDAERLKASDRKDIIESLIAALVVLLCVASPWILKVVGVIS